ncbi:MAG: tail fiber protein [Proteobacteria bacterium]|nr:tail fiber protein [Pseudomonadota bacterium]
MAESYLGEIRIFGGNFAPKWWALCQGQILAISQYDQLFSLLGTMYGGDGVTTFALPDLRGRLPVHQGQGPGLTQRFMGQRYGLETERLTVSQIPEHTHCLQASSDAAAQIDATGHVLANFDPKKFYEPGEDATQIRDFSPDAVAESGGNQPHTNTMPWSGINFIICTVGTYPSPN